MYDRNLVKEILIQVQDAIEKVIRRFKSIRHPEDFTNTVKGRDMLDAICMQLIAIGESFKNIEKITGQALLKEYPGIDWKGVKGIRDIITHHYFDIDAEEIYGICKNNIGPLEKVVNNMIGDLK